MCDRFTPPLLSPGSAGRTSALALESEEAVEGGVAWFPLGPREVYEPSYHVSRTYVTNVNVSNTTVNNTVVNNYYNNVIVNKNVTNIRYVNQTAPNGVTARRSRISRRRSLSDAT